MRAPDLEALIAEGEQEALLDYGYEYVVRFARVYSLRLMGLDSDDLHAKVGELLSTGELPPDKATTVYDAIWSVKRLLQDRHGPNKAVFTAEQWEEAARTLSGQLPGSVEKPHKTR